MSSLSVLLLGSHSCSPALGLGPCHGLQVRRAGALQDSSLGCCSFLCRRTRGPHGHWISVFFGLAHAAPL